MQLDANYVHAYLYRGVVYHVKGDIDNAITDYNQTIRLNPNDPVSYYYRGLAYHNTGQLSQAIGDYDHTLRLKPDYTEAAKQRQAAYQTLIARAQASYQQGRLDEAIANCTQLLRLNPREVTLLVLRGQCYYQKGQLDKALTDYDVALRLNPHDKALQKHRQEAYEAKHPLLRIGSERVCAKDGMEQVYVPAGKFKMGSRDDDPLADSDEKPLHEVYLDAYWIDKTPVTNAMFAKFVQETGYQTEAEKDKSDYTWRHPRGPKKFFGLVGGSDLTGKDNHPVVCVSWNDAVAYAKWAGRRLPTEAEWEKAAGGTDGRKWPWGNDPPTDKLCNFNSHVGDTSPVGNYPDGASPYGALDMGGNVWEWVNDTYEENYYASSPKANPSNESPPGTKVLRGGSWDYSARYSRVRFRDWDVAFLRVENWGFRCASLPSLVL